MNKQLQQFFEKTKYLHILLSIALLLIIITMVAPIGNGFLRYSGQFVIIIILMYILFKNFTETHNFVLIQKQTEKDRLKNKDKTITEDNILDIKNNTMASYALCGFILILLIYVIYSIFD